MISGRPRLAVWSLDNTLRLFELGESGAGQIWSTGLTQHANSLANNNFPYMGFSEDAFFLAMRYNPVTNNASHHTRRTVDGEGIGSALTVYGGGSSSYNNVVSAWSQPKRFLLTGPKSGSPTPDNGRTYYNELGVYTNLANPSFISQTRSCLAFAPDGLLFCGRSDGTPCVFPAEAENYISGQIPLNHLAAHRCTGAVWSKNGMYLLTYNTEVPSYGLTLLTRDEELTLVEYGNVPNPAGIGAPVAAAFSFDNRHVAVGYENGGVYTTVIFVRYGNILLERQRIGDMGMLLDFTEDGKILIDAGNKKAYENVGGTFTELVGFLSALPSNVRSQAISPHVSFITTTAKFYNGAVAPFVTGGIDFDALKLVLLSEDAVFDQFDESLEDVTGAGEHEVYGDGWDEGGVELTNVQLVQRDENSAAIIADTIERIIYREPLVFRYGVLIEDDAPRIWIDFGQQVSIMPNQKLTFDLQTLGIVGFVA